MSQHVEMEREVWAEDRLVESFLKDDDADENVKKAILGAILVHLVLLLVSFPSWGSALGDREERKVVYQIHQYTPPPRKEIKREIKQIERVKKVPLPDPTPDEPEPIREPDPEPEPPPLPDNVEVLFGMPKGPPAPQALRVGAGGISELKRTKNVTPEYPILAKKAEVEGLVVLDVLVDEKGKVAEIKVMKDMPMGLTQSAVQAVEQWEYEPARQFGRPVPAWMIVKVDFRLD